MSDNLFTAAAVVAVAGLLIALGWALTQEGDTAAQPTASAAGHDAEWAKAEAIFERLKAGREGEVPPPVVADAAPPRIAIDEGRLAGWVQVEKPRPAPVRPRVRRTVSKPRKPLITGIVRNTSNLRIVHGPAVKPGVVYTSRSGSGFGQSTTRHSRNSASRFGYLSRTLVRTNTAATNRARLNRTGGTQQWWR